jgi:hypothetical protein
MPRTPCVERCIMRSALLLLLAGISMAAADPLAPLRVQTVQIQPADAPAMPPAQPTMFPKVHTLSVRPGYPGEPRDGSGRPLFTPRISDGSAFDADPRMVGTLRFELDPVAARTPDRRSVHTIRVPAEAAPQDTIETQAARQRLAPMQREP